MAQYLLGVLLVEAGLFLLAFACYRLWRSYGRERAWRDWHRLQLRRLFAWRLFFGGPRLLRLTDRRSRSE